ncbi:putative pentatricopeptide repeat-containing protein At5g37570 [Phragmites australis]|uniref:putative pentatricopeptide repeat-containing protein At5g37570 n=1 Tax=Phragmites australis TaxID=29695 RepID=UPI002D79E013|nr:putative pentatricopeptide repeat-containing protein At5g37570 [Phragmites australis]
MPSARAEEENRLVRLAARCASARQLDQLHARAVLLGHARRSFVAAKLVRAFADLGHLRRARAVAAALGAAANAFVWTALVRAHSQSDAAARDAVALYAQMHRCCPVVAPLTFTVSAALKAAARRKMLQEGGQVHVHVFKNGFQTDERIATTLVEFYAKCGRLEDARKVFDRMVLKDAQLWNTMIAGYMAVGKVDCAKELFEAMPERNTFTLVEMIGGYAAHGDMDSAKSVFEMAVANGEADAVVGTAMISGYAKSGNLDGARAVFDGMREQDVATWNVMIGMYSGTGMAAKAVDLFKVMLESRARPKVEPNHTTISTVAAACAQCGIPTLATWIQDYVDRQRTKLLNNHTVAALIDMHSKCGDIERAHALFCGWNQIDLICYSSMISAFGMHGRGKDAIAVFNEMCDKGLDPDHICFVSVLAACSHAGLLDEGRRYFQMMKDEYHIIPTVEHYLCMVDLLGRAGCVDEAYQTITHEMPTKMQIHAGIWGALLSACRTYSNVEIAEVAAKHLFKLEPDNMGNYVLLSNIYANARKWDGVQKIRALMRRQGMRKRPGWSQIDAEGSLKEFITSELHDSVLELVLELLNWELKDHGYTPIIEVE